MFDNLQNKVFTGLLSADPDVKYFENNKVKAKFSIPLRDGEETKWINCTAWNKTAEKVNERFNKGDLITVFGDFKTDTYNGRETVIFLVYNVI